MIDKSIRQHYQEGKEVDAYTAGKKTIWPVLKEQIKSKALPKEGRKLPNIIRAPLQRTALSKLGLGALNPILGLLSLFGIDPLGWAGRKLTEGGVKQAYQAGMTGFGSPAEGRELRQLEKRRDYMLHRRDVLGKKISEKNLEEVTNRINEIKGDPYEFEDRRTAAQRKQIIDQLYEFEDKKTAPLRTTPTVSVRQDPDTGDASIAEKIAAENRAAKEASDAMVAKEIAAAEAFRADKEKQEELARQAKAYAEAQAAKPPPQITQPTGGGNGGGQPQTGGGGYERGDYGGRGYHWAKGGRVDKALGGRVRDI